jgi:hypothetical protein
MIDILLQPNGLVHMKLIYSEDMTLIDYILYLYNDNNELIDGYTMNKCEHKLIRMEVIKFLELFY